MTIYDHIGANKLRTLTAVAFYPVLLLISTGLVFFLVLSMLYDVSNPLIIRVLNWVHISIFYELQSQPFNYWLNEGFLYVLTGVLGFCSIMLVISFFFGDELIFSYTSPHAREATKKTHPQLVSMVEVSAIAAGLPAPEVYVAPDESANLYSLGRGPKDACIIITEGALKILNKSELEAVLAYQMYNIGNREILMTTTGISFVYGIVMISALLPFSRIKIGRGLWGWIISLTLIFYGLIIAPAVQILISRARVFTSDAGAALITRNPLALLSALEKMRGHGTRIETIENQPLLSNMCILPAERPEKEDYFGYVFGWFDSHPDIEDRLLALADMEGRYKQRLEGTFKT
ncbi:MAG: M48 family metalloprotease [Elusimicrobiota bacterium]|jgi:heat shock protein HtpX|nr:M48 family metalloprotease [Elusimicrobiota bacterium]